MSTNELSGQEPDGSNDNRRDPSAVRKRVHRALDSFYHIEAANEDGKYTVSSGSGNTYTVNVSAGSCTCPDGQRGSWCKHAYRVAFVTGQLPDIDGVRVASGETESDDDTDTTDSDDTATASDDDTDTTDSDDTATASDDDTETLTERVERFEEQNPGASAIEAVSQLGIDPGQIERVEEVLA